MQGRFTFDGLGGRTNSFPSVDIANGAPFGDDPSTAADEGGPDTIGLNWPDARNGLNNEEAPVQFSDDKGESWTDTTRRSQGVVRHADLDPDAPTLSGLATLNRGTVGDGRSSSANGLTTEFLGDYNYAVATNDFGAAIWTDDWDGSVCPAINEYRQWLIDGAPTAPSLVQVECAPTFGASSNYAGAYPDPTP